MIVEVVPEPQAAADGLVAGQVGGGLIDKLLVGSLAEQLESLLPNRDGLTIVPTEVDEGVVDDTLIEQIRTAPRLGSVVASIQPQLADQLQPASLVIPEAVTRPRGIAQLQIVAVDQVVVGIEGGSQEPVLIEEEVQLGLELVLVAVGDAVRRLVDVLPIQAVAPVQIGQLGRHLEVDVVGLLVVLLQLDVQITGAAQEPGIEPVGRVQQGDPRPGQRPRLLLFVQPPALDGITLNGQGLAVSRLDADLLVGDLLYGAGQAIAIAHPQDVGHRRRAGAQEQQAQQALSHHRHAGEHSAADGLGQPVLAVEQGSHLGAVHLGGGNELLDLG
ncbi:hypothetical protein D3C85_689530 [compost metagenome]